MFTHGRCQAATAGERRHHVAAIADMVAGTGLVGLDVIGAEDNAILFHDVGLPGDFHPESESLFPVGIGWVGVGVTRLYHVMKNRPDGVEIVAVCFGDGAICLKGSV